LEGEVPIRANRKNTQKDNFWPSDRPIKAEPRDKQPWQSLRVGHQPLRNPVWLWLGEKPRSVKGLFHGIALAKLDVAPSVDVAPFLPLASRAASRMGGPEILGTLSL
jgi:hypothetical protein